MANPNERETPFLPDWEDATDQDLDRILKRHLPWIQSHVSKRLGTFNRSKGETGDFVQEAMVQFLKYGPRIRLSNDRQLRALLFKIVENTLCGKYAWFTAQRRDTAKERPLPPDTILNLDPPEKKQETPSQVAQQHENEAWARLGLELLEPDERELIILHYFQSLSFQKIGESLSISKAGAYQKYLLAMYHLIEKTQALKNGQIDEALGHTPSEEDE
jgi:RNA polymerase sigma factor (sigma-70 family)